MSELVIADKSDFVTVADAIREKAGLEDSLTFPDGFTEAIAAIEAGGGSGGDSGILMAYGAITPAEATNEIVLSHELGVIPNFIYLITTSVSTITKGAIFCAVITPRASKYGSNVCRAIGTTQTQAYYQTPRSYYRVLTDNILDYPSSSVIKSPYYSVDENAARIYGTNYSDYADYSQFETETYYWVAIYNPSITMWGDFA